MIALAIRAVVRSHRIVTTALLTLAVIAIVCSNGPQSPGTTLAAAALLLLPVHAWTAHATARALDQPTRDALVAASSARRVFVAQLVGALLLALVTAVVVVLAAEVSGVMGRAPTGGQWLVGGLAAVVGVALGTAIGTVTGPPFLITRGWQVLLALLALVLTPELLPVLSLARVLGNRAPSAVVGAAVAPVAGCLGGSLAVLVAAWLLVDRLR